MANSLKQYAIVGFFSEAEAQSAMKTALRKFKHSAVTFSNLSYCNSNIVYIHSDSQAEKVAIENFLLSLEGAQPKGCRFMVK